MAATPSPHLARVYITRLSHHVGAMEDIADHEFFTLASSSPLALNNLLARLRRLETMIQAAASK